MARRRKKPTLVQVFNEYNRKYFNNKLKISFLCIGKISCLGETSFYDDGRAPSITINKSLTKSGRFVRMVLLHEMAHVSLPWFAYHGPKFLRRIHRLVKQGAYDDLL